MNFIFSSMSTSWYFLLATILPLFATLLALIWAYYSLFAKKKKGEKRLLKGGSFGFNIVKRSKDLDDNPISSTCDKKVSINDKMSASSSVHDDKRPLIEDDDDVVKLSDIEVPKLEDVPDSPKREKTSNSKKKTDEVTEDDDDDDVKFDYPADMCGKLKSSKFIKATKDLEKCMTDVQKQEEAEIRRQQLESIFKLMREQEEKFGMQSSDELQEQLKLYAL